MHGVSLLFSKRFHPVLLVTLTLGHVDLVKISLGMIHQKKNFENALRFSCNPQMYEYNMSSFCWDDMP